MSFTELQPTIIEKENVPGLHFPKEDVLDSEDARKLRAADLERASILGNVEKYKIKIVFEDENSVKQVDTTIWACGPENIVLKQGVFIPVHRIHGIQIL